ncbi:MAG: hypothetical protein MJ137_06350 [Clostridia bacterium]|nr:hypothetical protein [Clostridia bacterium]
MEKDIKNRFFRLAFVCVLASLLLLSVLPVAAETEKTPIHRFSAVSETPITAPELGKPVQRHILFETTEGAPLLIFHQMNGWQRKQESGVFWTYNDEYFVEGTYRYWFQVRCEDPAFGIASDITGFVNGEEIFLNKYTAYFTDGPAGYVDFYSAEFEVKISDGTPVSLLPDVEVSVPESFAGTDLKELALGGYFYGGKRPYKFALTSGPSWLKLAEDGTVSGKPEKAGKNEPVAFTVTDAAGVTASFSVNVGETHPNPEDRKPIPTVKITSDRATDEIYIGSPVFLPGLTVTEGAPAEIGDAFWVKLDKDGGDIYSADVFTEGEYFLVIEVTVRNHTEQLTEKTEFFLDGKKTAAEEGFDDSSFFSVALIVGDTVTAKTGTPPVVTEPVTEPVTTPVTSPVTSQITEPVTEPVTGTEAAVTTEGTSAEKGCKDRPAGAMIAMAVLGVAVGVLTVALVTVLVRRKK